MFYREAVIEPAWFGIRYQAMDEFALHQGLTTCGRRHSAAIAHRDGSFTNRCFTDCAASFNLCHFLPPFLAARLRQPSCRPMGGHANRPAIFGHSIPGIK
ncbi:hypothetical protein Tamer19_11830 [Cupriavidus sp. TA19]|nr:hypothetical protein Tamer19_11830 [Cupriavidus sp. TA19]